MFPIIGQKKPIRMDFYFLSSEKHKETVGGCWSALSPCNVSAVKQPAQ